MNNPRHPFPEGPTPLPCPFCGGALLALEEAYVNRSPGRAAAFFVNCDSCRANGPWEVAAYGGEVPQTKGAAVTAWNRRIGL